MDVSLRLMRKAYPVKYKLRGQLDAAYSDRVVESASDLIHRRLTDDQPLMVSRFGSIEMNCVLNFINQRGGFQKYVRYITGKTDSCIWQPTTISAMSLQAGFFPGTIDMLSRFSELMLQDMREIDIFGSWLKEEVFFAEELKNADRIGLMNLEPYNHTNPWSRALEGKKVLVIHPYDESIKIQYGKRRLLFEDERVLPEFDLQTLKAVQSIANNKTGYKDWFAALDHMKMQVEKLHFDVAILGCGAYGLPLAAFIKRMGRKAVHLGGATQILFGIRGKRWESNYHDYDKRFMNSHWSRPLLSEMPENYNNVEDGCYW